MIHILWIFLKIIGILLLVLVGILFFCLLGILFVPVFYRLEGSYIGKPDIKIRANWLFHLMAFVFYYDGEKINSRLWILGLTVLFCYSGEKKEFRVKFCGFPLYPSARKKKRKRIKKSKHMRKTKQGGRKRDGKKKKPIEITKDPEILEKVAEETSSDTRSDEESQASRKEVESYEKKMEKNPFKKIKSFFKNLRDRISQIAEKIKWLLSKKENFLIFIRDEENKTAFSKIKSEIWLLVRHIRPKKMKVYLKFGFENPAWTGMCLGALSMLYPFYAATLRIEPDFEHLVLEGEWMVKGHVIGGKFLLAIWRVCRQKECIALYKRIMKKD